MHWPHLALATALLSVASAMLAAPVALAGGWAITTLDELPAVIRAGETYPIGYTIRQHGQTPFTSAQSGIEIRAPNGGASQRFAGQAEGAPGHYVAQVRFPEPGEWEWVADQTPFQPQPLGRINIMAVATEPAPVHLAASESAWRLALPLATVLAVALFAWRLVVFVRPTRAAVSRSS